MCACRVLDGPVDELRVPALDTIASLAVALGPDFPLFAPTVRKVRALLSGQTGMCCGRGPSVPDE